MPGLIPFVCLAAIILATGRIVRRLSPAADWHLAVLAGATLFRFGGNPLLDYTT